jgi:hypothetical protein
MQMMKLFASHAMIAIGKKGPKDNLLPQLQKREYPTNRKPLAEIIIIIN